MFLAFTEAKGHEAGGGGGTTTIICTWQKLFQMFHVLWIPGQRQCFFPNSDVMNQVAVDIKGEEVLILIF